MNECLEVVITWLLLNKIDIAKTVYITFGDYKDSVSYELNMTTERNRLKRIEHCKYLVVVFDFSMNLDKYIEYIVKETKYLIFVSKIWQNICAPIL